MFRLILARLDSLCYGLFTIHFLQEQRMFISRLNLTACLYTETFDDMYYRQLHPPQKHDVYNGRLQLKYTSCLWRGQTFVDLVQQTMSHINFITCYVTLSEMTLTKDFFQKSMYLYAEFLHFSLLKRSVIHMSWATSGFESPKIDRIFAHKTE